MNPFDLFRQQSFPTVMAPSREPVEPMTRPGERLLVGSNGVFLEVLRPWVHVVRRAARFEAPTPIPYGAVAEVTQMLCDPVPPALIADFLAMARVAVHVEVGAWIVWNERTGQHRMVPLPALSHGPSHLHYERPALDDGDWVVVDCHSHGRSRAFFSRTDNEDDKFDVKLALVLGHCHRVPSTALRLCVKGIVEQFDHIPASWRQALSVEVVQ